MANQPFLDILKQGVDTWNPWRQAHPDILQPDLRTAHLEGASLRDAHLEGANLSGAHLEGANLGEAHLEKANLSGAFLEGANLRGAHLEGANLNYAQLDKVNLSEAHLEGASLRDASLVGANLQLVFLDNTVRLDGVTLSDGKNESVSLVDVNWGNVNLSVVDWTLLEMLGEERKARQTKYIGDYRTAVRANRQLAVALQSQGLSEEADQCSYRAQLLLRTVWWHQRRLFRYIFSWFLFLIAGYGYRPLRSLVAYLLLVTGFAAAFYAFGHLAWYEALIVSLTAFHGRGFFSQQYQPGDPQAIIAAFEAVAGLLIEVSFIATFTQRFFGR
jgi:hypothetical protein